MKAFGVVSCILLLSFGACFPPDDSQELRCPREGFGTAAEQPELGVVQTPRWTRSAPDLNALVSIAKELQSFGQEKAGIRFRFGRQQDALAGDNEVLNYPREEDGGKKRGDALGSLAEELNGYVRKKGGFSFRFGRGRRAAHV
ncbi:hypothetical protein lerEdw1_015853 [Lerista edwardsae]|nr:hypothetical protein lerEdw1_015853 [Lerista edwardsae]